MNVVQYSDVYKSASPPTPPFSIASLSNLETAMGLSLSARRPRGECADKREGRTFFAPINFAAAPRRLSLSEASDCKQAAKKETLDSLSLAPGNFSSCPFDAAVGGGRGEVRRRRLRHHAHGMCQDGPARTVAGCPSGRVRRDAQPRSLETARNPRPESPSHPYLRPAAEPSVMMTVVMDEHRASDDISSVKIVLVEWC